MFLTMQMKIADTYNDDGQGRARRTSQEPVRPSGKKRPNAEPKGALRGMRLSHKKKAILREASINFSEAWQKIVQHGLADWNNIPFKFGLTDKAGQPILDKNGNQKMQLTSAHYLVNGYIYKNVPLRDTLNPRMANSVRNQAAETLLSQYRLRETAVDDPRRLTGPEVGAVQARKFRQSEVDDDFVTALAFLADPGCDDESLKWASSIVRRSPEARPIPITLSSASDFRFFRHRETGQLFVCVPLLHADDRRAKAWPKEKDRERKLMPLRIDQEDFLSSRNTEQWVLLPLQTSGHMIREWRRGGRIDHSKLGHAERMISDPANTIRTAELFERDGEWYFNVVIKVPDAEPITPRRFLGVRVGYYAVSASVIDPNGAEVAGAQWDISDLKSVAEAAAKQRRYAFDRERRDLHDNYRGILKFRRERVANEIVALALEHGAAICVEDVSGVEKSTHSKRANLHRSHWDFGAFIETMRYKSIIAGLPTIGVGRTLFSVYSSVALGTCSACGASNSGKPEGERPVLRENGTTTCRACGIQGSTERNVRLVIARKGSEHFAKKAKKVPVSKE